MVFSGRTKGVGHQCYDKVLTFLLSISICSSPNVADEAASLSSQELRQLQDFVNRRGKGSISRLAIDVDPLQLPDPDLEVVEENKFADLGSPPPFQPFEIIMPSKLSGKLNRSSELAKNLQTDELRRSNGSTSSNTDEPEHEDYEKLAKLLQRFLNRHKSAENNFVGWDSSTSGKMEQLLGNAEHAHEEEIMKANTTSMLPMSSDGPEKERTKGKVIGTLPVSVEIGGNGEGAVKETIKDELDLKMDSEKKEMDYDRQDMMIMAEKNVDDRQQRQDKISWIGSVEKVATLKMSPRHQESGTVNSNTNSQIRPQILGRVLIQPNNNNNLSTTSVIQSDNQRIRIIGDGVEEKTHPFYYQLSGSDDEIANGSTKAHVTVLREGLARQSHSQYTFIASITLIQDDGKVILVDTGMGTDINGRTDLIQKLSHLNVAPPSVDYVVLTHGHPDHSGNTNDFPDAVHFQGVMSHHRTKFNFTDLFENDRHQLTTNVALIHTPGHTSEDISVTIKNANNYGSVAIAGDVFVAVEDLERPMMWRPLAWNETAQEESRKMLLCTADYVVPGHGKMFHVTKAMRETAGCSGEGSVRYRHTN